MRIVLLISIVIVSGIGGCAEVSPIVKADESKSFFEGSVYPGRTKTIHIDKTGAQQYRLFQQGATGFVPRNQLKDECEQRASKFCGDQKKVLKVLQETMSPPAIGRPGNFPRVELVFICTAEEEDAASSYQDETYIKLSNLKKLLDNGTITKDEFESQKANILKQ